jgi:glycine hydroxymethyltransferase
VVKNARTLAEILMERGYRMVSGGTDTHLLIVDLTPKGLTGKTAEAALEASGIHVNRNAIPFDEKPPMVASGIRIGTSAATTRGMREGEMRVIADAIDKVLNNPEDKALQERKRKEIAELAARFPLLTS